MATGNNPSAYEPAPVFSEAFPWATAISAGGGDILDTIAPRRSTTITDTSQQTQLGQPGISEMIYQLLSGQGGIADIKSAEAASGGYGSSTASLGIADLLAQTAAKIGGITAPKTTHEEQRSKKKKSIICTRLYALGKLSREEYLAGQVQFEHMDPDIIAGYNSWAYKLADKLPYNKFLTALCQFIMLSRYDYVLYKRWNLVGALTVYFGEPICAFLGKKERYAYR